MRQHPQAAPAKVNLALDILGRRPDGYQIGRASCRERVCQDV